MPITMGGMASGIDTDNVIKKLVDVEARPIRQWENEIKASRRKKEALNGLKSRLTNLSNAAKDLYGFRASYNDKRAISSNPGVLEATASKFAKNGVRKIEVIELATTHKISSDTILKDRNLPSGKFRIEVNGESEIIKFRGGKLKSLQRKIEETASDLVSTSTIKTTDKNYILTIESKTPGKKGEIILNGDKKLLKTIGLIKGEKGESKNETDIILDKKYFTSYIGDKTIKEQNGSLRVDNNGRSLTLKSIVWKEYILPVAIPVKKDTTLEFNIDINKPKKVKEKEEVLPYRIEIGPEEKVIIKGIELKGYNISRIRSIEEKKIEKEIIDDVVGIGIVSVDNGTRREKIYSLDKNRKGKQEMPVGIDFSGKIISKIVFYCNDGIATFSDVRIITPLKGYGILEPKNIITKANDAKLKVDGIEVVRDKNNNLDDVLKGVTLNIRNTSKIPVSLTIEPDIEKAVDKIKKFVQLYNEYLDYNKQLTKASKTTKPGEYNKVKYTSGPFVGDMTISRLENSLKTVIGEAYHSMADKPIRIFPQIGVSTGAINADWESIKEGKLLIDEEMLKKVIMDNPEGILEFFGSDTDGDDRIDNGLGYRLVYTVKPYIQTGKNIIVAKIDMEDNAIKSSEDRIERQKEHLKKYEDKLRRKFTAMEKAVSGAKSQGNWMKSQMKGMGNSGQGSRGK